MLAQKSPERILDQDEGVAGRNRKEQYPPIEGSLICPQGNVTKFLQKANRNNCVSGLG